MLKPIMLIYERLKRHGGIFNIFLTKCVEKALQFFNLIFLKNYKKLDILFSTELFSKREFPKTFVDSILEKKFGEFNIKLSINSQVNQNILHDGYLAWIVSRCDMKRMEKTFHTQRTGAGVSGGKNAYIPTGGIGGLFVDATNRLLKTKFSFSSPLLRLHFPCDLAVDADKNLYIATNNKIIVRSSSGKVSFIHDPYLSFPRSIAFNAIKDKFVVSCSGTDTLLIYDLKSKGIQRWSAYDYGYNLNASTSVDVFVAFEDSPLVLSRKPSNFKLISINRAKPEHLGTVYETTHINDAIFHPQDQSMILASLFATKRLDNTFKRLEQEGTGGQIILIDTKTNKHIVVLEGLNNPHDLTYLGFGLYVLTNTSSGEVIFYKEESMAKWEPVGKISFDKDMSEPMLREHPWIIGLNFTVDSSRKFVYMSLEDGSRKRMFVIRFDLEKFILTRASVRFPWKWGIQNVLFWK